MTTSLLLKNGTSIMAATTALAVGDLFAVYGTLRAGHGNYDGTGMRHGSEFVGLGTVRGEMRTVGCPGYIPYEDGSPVVVEVYRLTDEALAYRLDSLEGYNYNDPEGSWYKRSLTDVAADDGSTVYNDVHIYVWGDDYERLPVVESGDWNVHTGRGTINRS